MKKGKVDIEKISRQSLELKKELKKFIKLKSPKGSLHITTRDNIENAKSIIRCVDNINKKSCLKNIPATKKFATTIGIEYTFLIKESTSSDPEPIRVNFFESNFTSNSLETSYSRKLEKELDKRQRWNRETHRDGDGIIECPSPIHKNWNDMLTHYRVLTKAAKKVGLVTHKGDEGGGGGHIHMCIPQKMSTEDRLRFLSRIFLDMARRPYLNWIFNESVDVLNANSMLTSLEGFKFISTLMDKHYFNIYDYNCLIGCTKDYGIRFKADYDTIEFRIFDMPRDEQTLEEYIEFANAYFSFIEKDMSYPSSCSVDLYSLSNTSYDIFRDKKHVIKEFNILLRELGLNPARYKKYIDRNYQERLDMAKAGELKMDYDILKELELPLKESRNEEFLENELVDVATEEEIFTMTSSELTQKVLQEAKKLNLVIKPNEELDLDLESCEPRQVIAQNVEVYDFTDQQSSSDTVYNLSSEMNIIEQ